MIKLVYYPDPEGNFVFFISSGHEEVQQLLLTKWFEGKPLDFETDHKLDMWKTEIEKTQFLEILFYISHNRGYRATFQRDKAGKCQLIHKNGDIEVNLLSKA